jgi:GST-like protein
MRLPAMDDVPNGRIRPDVRQYNRFANYAVQKIPHAIERCAEEVRRLHRVLNKRPAEAEHLAGPDYSMADIIIFPGYTIWIVGTLTWETIPT